MTLQAQNSRPLSRVIIVIATGMALGFVALAGWLATFQVVDAEHLTELARANRQKRSVQPPRRGAIRDVMGNVLASSVPVKTVCADPGVLWDKQSQLAGLIAPILGLQKTWLEQKLHATMLTNSEGKLVTNRYVVLQHKVPIDKWNQLTQAVATAKFGLDDKKLPGREKMALRALREKGLFGLDDEQRLYPGGSLAAHVVGYVSSDETEKDEGRLFQTQGQGGIENTMDDVLGGVHGWKEGQQVVAARPGQDVYLTIDAAIQNILEQEAEKGMQKYTPVGMACIAVRPRDGAILGLCNLPTFDPNRVSKFPVANLCNRAISNPSEQGSTFKVVVVSGALDRGLVTLQDLFDCENGHFKFAGRMLHDHASYAILSVMTIITKSSNIGAAKIGIKMGKELLHRYIAAFGFGTKTGIPLPGESRGMVRPLGDWQEISISRIPMGHEVLVTPIQMVMAMATIANGGKLMKPMLVDRVMNEQGELLRKFQPREVAQVISPAAAREMIKALKTVPTKEGTAVKARLEHYTVAGKTGTAELFANGTYKSGRYISSFIGFFPADRPEIVISVLFEDLYDPDHRKGHYGGDVAGPVWRAIAERVAAYMKIPAEDPESGTQAQTGVSQQVVTIKPARAVPQRSERAGGG